MRLKTTTISKFINKIKIVSIFVLLLIKLPANAQEPLLVQHLSFSSKELNLAQLSKEIQSQTDIGVSFDAKRLKSNKHIKLPNQHLTVKQLAASLRKNYGIETKIIGRHILMIPSSNASKEIVTRKENNARKKIVKLSNEFNRTLSLLALNPIKVETSIMFADTVYSFNDTFTMSQKLAAQVINQMAKESDFANIDEFSRLDSPSVIKIATPFWEQCSIAASISGNELFFLRPSIQLGFANFFATGSYAINSSVSHFRYGLSYHYSVNDKFGLSLSVSTGNMKKNVVQNWSYTYVIPDSVPITVTIDTSMSYQIRGRLTRWSLDANYSFGNRMELFCGLSYNQIHSSIYYQNALSSPNVFVPNTLSLNEKDFQILNNSFLLGTNYSYEKSAFRQSAIGLQVGFRYYFLRKKSREN